MSGFGVGLSLQTCTVWKATASCVSGRTNPLSASKIRPCHYNKHRTSQRTPFSYSQIQCHTRILSSDFRRLCLELPSPTHELSTLYFSCLKWLGCVFCSCLLWRLSSAVQHPGTVKRSGTATAVLFITQMHDRRSHESPTQRATKCIGVWQGRRYLEPRAIIIHLMDRSTRNPGRSRRGRCLIHAPRQTITEMEKSWRRGYLFVP